jgi:hypothetical protein
MSTKTLRKRIALVAATALGAGLLTVVAVPSANAAAAAAADYAVAAGTPLVQCFDSGQTVTSSVGVESIGILSTNTAAFTSSASLSAGETATLTITGSATFTAYTAAASNPLTTTLSDDAKTLKFVAAGSAVALPTSITLTPSAVGTVTVRYRDVTTTSTVRATTYVYVTASCSDTATVSVADSAVQLDTESTAFTAATADSVDDTGTDLIANRGSVYVLSYLVDKFGNAVSGASTHALIATATGDATIGINAASATAKTAVLAGTGSNLEDPVVYVTCPDQNAASTTTVKLSYDGVEAWSKSIKCAGDVAKVVATQRSKTLLAGGANAGAISYQIFDDAGNALRGKAATIHGASATGVMYTSATGSATTSYTTTNSTLGTAGRISVAMGAAGIGLGTAKIRALMADGSTYVYSDVMSFTSSTATISKYSASLDAAAYSMGGLITLTIKATDAYGLPVADGTALGSTTADLNVSVSGATAVTAPAYTDTSKDGAWEYKYTAGINDGMWVAGVQLKHITGDTAKQSTYKINSSGGVSNADVLKAIVSLIASINKQIAALQKALLKK